ncbi:MAG: FtsX-like permease family protein [Chryseolinea sp.]
MFKNYLKTALRNLGRQGTSTVINLSGLTLGITCSLVLFLLVRHMSSFDEFHSRGDRIYRVVHQSKGNHGKEYTAGVPAVLPDAFRLDFPEAEEVVFTSYRSDATIVIPQANGTPKLYQEKTGTVYTQSNFFKVFDQPIVSGNKTTPLDDPNTATISRRSALKYFGTEDALGQVVKFGDKEFRITGIMENPPKNTDFPFDLMLSHITIKKANEENGWNSIWSDEQCYFLLKENQPLSAIESRLKAFTEKYQGKDNRDEPLFTVQPLREIHFDDRYGTYTYATASKGVLIGMAAIAIILVITACINFVNLATAEAIKRSKEVGIRKALGSTRAQLIGQFLGETSIVALISSMVSIALAQLSLTLLNPFLKLELSFDILHDPALWAYLIGVTIVVAMFSGLYPAFVVSGYNPALALKNLISNKNSSGYNLRRALVVGQFVISQFFIFGTIVLVNQMDYFKSKDLGFNKDAIIVVPIPEDETPPAGTGSGKMRTLRDELLRSTGVVGASLNSTPPSSGSVSGTSFEIEGKDEFFETQVKQIDGNYIDLYEMKVIAGENIADLDTAQNFVVNEQFCHTVGFKPEEIIGKEIKMWGKRLPVKGVVKDFHTVSLRDPIEATIMLNRLRGYESLSLKVNVRQATAVIDKLKPMWEHAYPQAIFSYQFLDEQLREFYETEERMSVLLGIFSSIAILIGCLGLFGLATFLANQKTKEIGVRKVLGASVESIVILFTKEYIKLIGIGFLISAPLAWYIMNQFLQEFTYRIEIGPGIFVIGLVTTLLIAMMTVGYKSFKSAIANPAHSLRSE